MSTTVRPPREESHQSLDLSPFPMGRESPPRVRRRPRVPRRLLGLLLGMGAVGAVAYFGLTPVWSSRDAIGPPDLGPRPAGDAPDHRHRARQPREPRDRRRDLRAVRLPEQDHPARPRGEQGREGGRRRPVRLGGDREEHRRSRTSRPSRPSRRSRRRSRRSRSRRTRGRARSPTPRSSSTLAVLDLEKYQKGDYVYEVDDLKAAIGLSTKDLEEAKNQARVSSRRW